MKSAKSVSDAITAPVLLLVEGEDEEYLVQAMCLHWFQGRAQQIDIESVGGRDNFPKRFRALAVRTPGPLKVVGVIADSEENAQATSQRWSVLFDEVGPKVNRPCRKLQLPNEAARGAFESLVLTALDGDAVANCAKTFRDCVAAHIGVRTLAQMDKIAVQAWLSALLGNAYGNVFKAQKDYPEHQLLDYDHEAFSPIKTFLEDLLAEVDVVPEV